MYQLTDEQKKLLNKSYYGAWVRVILHGTVLALLLVGSNAIISEIYKHYVHSNWFLYPAAVVVGWSLGLISYSECKKQSDKRKNIIVKIFNLQK